METFYIKRRSKTIDKLDVRHKFCKWLKLNMFEIQKEQIQKLNPFKLELKS